MAGSSRLVRLIIYKQFILWLLAAGLVFSSQLLAKSKAEVIENQTIKLIVTIEGDLGKQKTFGAGIVIGSSRNILYIVTANHVVRQQGKVADNLTVRFKDIPGDFISAQVLEVHDAGRDIAVVQVSNIRRYGLEDIDFPFDLLMHSTSLASDSDLYKIGYPFYRAWSMPAAPDTLDSVTSFLIYFRSNFLKSGHSGGGLIDAQGNVIGMVLGNTDRIGLGYAAKIDSLIAQIKTWNLPVGFVENLTIEHNVSAAGSVADIGENSGWAKFYTSDLNYLPPIPDFVGPPDYKLKIISKNRVIRPAIQVGRKSISYVFRAKDFGIIELSIVEEDFNLFGSGDTQITDSKQLSFDDALLGKRIRLTILNSLFHKYPELDTGKDQISFYFKAESFNPNQESGADYSPQNANKLLPDKIIDDHVNFNQGDAIDHIKLPQNCLAALLVNKERKFKIKPVGLNASRVVTTIPIVHKDETKNQRLFIIDSKQTPGCVLRLQAEGPDGYADYQIFNIKTKFNGEADMVSLIDTWLRNKYYSSLKHHSGFREYDAAGLQEAIAALRRHYSISVESLVPIYNQIIVDEKNDKWPAMQFVIGMIAEGSAEYLLTTKRCCSSYSQLLQLLSIKNMEMSKKIDRNIAKKGLNSKYSGLVIFTINTIGKSNDAVLVQELLTPLLLHNNDAVASTARRVLLDSKRGSME